MSPAIKNFFHLINAQIEENVKPEIMIVKNDNNGASQNKVCGVHPKV